MDLIVILGDQLTPQIAALADSSPDSAVVLMAEVAVETEYAWHHKQKLVLVLSAMRHFATELRVLGWTVDYVQLTDPANSQSLDGEVQRAAQRHRPDRIIATEAAEWRVTSMQQDWSALTGVRTVILEDDRFIASHALFDRWAAGRKEWRMEFFYRENCGMKIVLLTPQNLGTTLQKSCPKRFLRF